MSKPILKYSDTYAEVNKYLFVGGCVAAENLSLLGELGVTAVIVIKEVDLLVKAPDTKYVHYSFADVPREPLHEKFDEIADFIEDERRSGGVIYVSCHRGMSRSISAVLAYLVKYGDYTLRDAYTHLRSIRPCLDVNRYFMIKLTNFENRIRKSSTVDLVRWRGAWWPDLPGY